MAYLLIAAAALFPLVVWTATRTRDMFSVPDAGGNPRFIALGERGQLVSIRRLLLCV